ncbi:MAG: protein-glutamate O-methyltransferase CheR [Candidatus Micrarchaeota archaeon]|nr:protein-glutamate O-methyltransferase CheR [Candidatus Micrarchaeota archaeon]
MPENKITQQEFNLITELVEKYSGIHLEDEKMYLVESRLTPLLVENGCNNFIELYHKAINDKVGALREKIVDLMTTNETLWFRDSAPFEILKGLLKELSVKIKSGIQSKIRIWSAACSTGQEPYSIAITILESISEGLGIKPNNVEIIATDISPKALFIAKLGRYDSIAISRGLPEKLREKYFRNEGKIWIISDNVKNMVNFKKMNLQESFLPLGKMDIVFCRNVLIYFSEKFKQEVLNKIAETLKPSGYLIVGASESVLNYSNQYTMLKNGVGLYYKVK